MLTPEDSIDTLHQNQNTGKCAGFCHHH